MGVTVFFGGTFNPPHISHRKMLEAVCDRAEVERVLVAPTNIPPHKAVAEKFASAEDRLNMCELLCDGLPKAETSDIEFLKEGKSYSFYTLSDLKKEFSELAMLIGGDMLTTFTEWFNYKGVLKLVTLYAVRRRGVDNTEFDLAAEHLRYEGAKITVIDVDLPEISSTEIRKSISENGVSKAIPKNISDYIIKNGLYR